MEWCGDARLLSLASSKHRVGAHRIRQKRSDFTDERRILGHKLIGGTRNGSSAGEAGVVYLNVAPRVFHL